MLQAISLLQHSCPWPTSCRTALRGHCGSDFHQISHHPPNCESPPLSPHGNHHWQSALAIVLSHLMWLGNRLMASTADLKSFTWSLKKRVWATVFLYTSFPAHQRGLLERIYWTCLKPVILSFSTLHHCSQLLAGNSSDVLQIQLIGWRSGDQNGITYTFSGGTSSAVLNVTLDKQANSRSGDWQFLAITHNSSASRISIYINSTLRQDVPVTDGSTLFPLASMLNYTVAGLPPDSSMTSFAGNLEDFLLYTFPLSVLEVNQLAEGAASFLDTTIEPQCLCQAPSVFEADSGQCLMPNQGTQPRYCREITVFVVDVIQHSAHMCVPWIYGMCQICFYQPGHSYYTIKLLCIFLGGPTYTQHSHEDIESNGSNILHQTALGQKNNQLINLTFVTCEPSLRGERSMIYCTSLHSSR